MIISRKILVLLCLVCICNVLFSQDDYCVGAGGSIDLNTIDFDDCDGPLTYDITNSSGGLNCTDCGNIINPTSSENITVTAYEDGDECGEEVITIIYLEATINAVANAAPDCNTINFDADVSNSVVSYQWDFNNDNIIDSNDSNPTWTFEANGNQLVELTVLSAGGECTYTTTINVFVDGPWADLTILVNPDGDDDFEDIDLITFLGNACTVPFCVDDVDNVHCVNLTDIPNPNPAGNTLYEVFIDGASIYSAAVGPSDFEYCFPAGFAGYSYLDYVITDANGCSFTKTYQVYIAEFIFPVELVSIVDPILTGNCIDDELEFVITADPINPEDVTYIIAIDCSNQNYFEIVGGQPLFLDTLYLAPGESQTLTYDIAQSSCFCDFPYQFSIYTFGSNPCTGNPIASNTAPFSVKLDTDASFTAPDIICENTELSFLWEGGEFLGTNICDVDVDWSITEPDGDVILSAGDDPDFSWIFNEAGEYEVCLLLDSECTDLDSEQCEIICVEAGWGNADLQMTWPIANDQVYCPGFVYDPEALVDVPLCTPLVYNWTVSPATGATVTNANTADPTITFNTKGTYTVSMSVSSQCGFASSSYSTIEIGAPPIVEVNLAAIGGCPGEPICLDEAFCVDDCNAPFTSATVSIYAGAPPADCDPGALPAEWEAAGNPLVVFPADNQGINCNPSSGVCDFLWDVPDGLEGTFFAVVDVTNNCGTDIGCFQINISPPVIPAVDFQTTFCAGDLLNPATSNFFNCTWSDENGVIWNPGNGNITMTESFTLTINCSASGCPFEIEVDITVNPLPTVTIDGVLAICDGGSTTLTALTTAGQIDWYNTTCANVPFSASIETGDELLVSSAGTYSVLVEDANGCQSCTAVVVTTDESPNFNCFPDSYCESDGTEIIDLSCLTPPSSGWTTDPIWNVDQDMTNIATDITTPYSVDDLLTDYSTEINSNTIFDFSYSWTSDLGCLYADTVEIEILNEGVNYDTLSVCTDTELFINGGVSGSWEIIDMPASAGVDFVGSSFSWIPEVGDEGGLYSLEFYPTGGCAFDSILVEVFLSPTVELTIAGSGSLCEGGDIVMEATPGFDYQWFQGGTCAIGFQIGGATEDTFTASMAGTYSVQVIDENSCLACDDITISSDLGPSFLCDDVQFCENEIDEEFSFDCLSPPPTGWEGTDPVWSVNLEGAEIETDLSSPYSVTDLLDDLSGELTDDSDFQIIYNWSSSAGCDYSDSITFTILNEGLDTTYYDVCSGEFIGLTPDGSDGAWILIDVPIGSDIDTDTESINWQTTYSDIGGPYDAIYNSGLGCSTYQYYFEIFETPVGTISPTDNEMCIEGEILFDLDSGISTDQILEYEYADGNILLDENTGEFEPATLGLEPTDDGIVIYSGSVDYYNSVGILTTCSFNDTADVLIVDYPESLFFPSALCEGDEFEPTVCTDPYIDNFELTIDGVVYDTCPLEFGTLNGSQDYTLVAFYGDDLNCQIDTMGTIVIQEQLQLEVTSTIDSCSAEAIVNIEVLSGDANSIIFSPSGFFADNTLYQELTLPFEPLDDEFYNFTIEIDDAGCFEEEFTFEGMYVAPLNPAILIGPGPYCDDQLIEFELLQTGSSVLDSIIVFPGNEADPSYTWIDDNYTDPIEFAYESPLDSTLYTIGFQLFNPCHDTLVELDFIVDPPQLIASMDPNFEGCPGAIIDLDPNITGTYSDADVIVEPGLNLSLVDPDEAFIFQIADNQAAGFYTIEINFESDCGEPISVFTEVEVFPIPDSEVSFTTQCTGQLSTFEVSNSSLSETYEWTIEGQTQFGTEAEFTFNALGDYIVELETTNLNGCSSIIEIPVVIGGVEMPILFDPFGQCNDLNWLLEVEQDAGESVHWTIISDQSSDIQEYFVNFQSVNFFNTSTEFSVTYQINVEVTDLSGCSSEAGSFIEIYPDGTAEIEYFDGLQWINSGSTHSIFLNEVCSEEIAYFRDATFSNACGWWTSLNVCPFGAINPCPEFLICANADDDGFVNLTTINEYGCVATDSVYVTSFCGDDAIFYVPSAFTPDDDGVNDVFYVAGTNFNPDQFELLIFDRWGDVVFKTNDPNEGWLGENNNGDYYVDDDVYNYLITAYVKGLPINEDNERVFRGHITILR